MNGEEPLRERDTPGRANSPLLDPEEEFRDSGETCEDSREAESYEHQEEEDEDFAAAAEEESAAGEFVPETEAHDEWESAEWEAEAPDRELEPDLVDLAERTMAGEVSEFEDEAPRRWTRCFTAAEITKVEKAYQDNTAAAAAHSGNRCSCIVMLNVALGQLLPLRLKESRARNASSRRVQIADLTNETIEKAMAILRRRGFAAPPVVMNFYDRRNRTAGTLKPERLKSSVRSQVLGLSKTKGCWFAFGLSLMDGYHSVLLLVDRTGADAKIWWLDQFSAGLTVDVSSTLDQRITERTQTFWQGVMDSKNKGYNTNIRLWQLKKPRRNP